MIKKNKNFIKTKNKKYFKRFNISDLVRLNINLGENLMKVNFMNNTLVISYKKSDEFLKKESEILNKIRKIRAEIKKILMQNTFLGYKNK